MPLSANYNATFTLTRQTRTGTEDGTPIYADSIVVVAGWWDEVETRPLDEPFRDQNISFADRRALFLTDPTADIQQDDTGTALVGGIDRGYWQVSVIRAAPIPSGVGHLEIQMQGVKESK